MRSIYKQTNDSDYHHHRFTRNIITIIDLPQTSRVTSIMYVHLFEDDLEDTV